MSSITTLLEDINEKYRRKDFFPDETDLRLIQGTAVQIYFGPDDMPPSTSDDIHEMLEFLIPNPKALKEV